MSKAPSMIVTEDMRKKLAFQVGLLTLMKGTVPLYSPMIEKALDDIDDILEEID